MHFPKVHLELVEAMRCSDGAQFVSDNTRAKVDVAIDGILQWRIIGTK